MSVNADPNAEALRCLLDGPMLASDIAARVGWEPRVAGQKMAALERQGFVMREIYKSSAGPSNSEKVIYRWNLAARGQAIANTSPGSDATPTGSIDDAQPALQVEPEQTIRPAQTEASADTPLPGVVLRLELSEWLLVLAAARQGASSTRADRAQAIRRHLTTLEQQADVRWSGQGYVPRNGE